MHVRHFAAVFACLVVGSMVWMLSVGALPVVAFQLSFSREKAEAIVGAYSSAEWVRMRESFLRDSLYLLAYTGLFASFGLQISERSKLFGWLIVILAIATGTADVLENTNALRILSQPMAQSDNRLFYDMTLWSRTKWGLVGALCLFLGWANLRFPWNRWSRAAAFIFLAAAAGFAVGAVLPAVNEFPALLLCASGGATLHLIAMFRPVTR